MALRTTALLSVGVLLFLARGAPTDAGPATLPLRLTVENDLSNVTPETHFCSVVEGGVLLGALRRLQETQQDFKFSVRQDPDFGLLLLSVNGVAADEREQTYWEILSESSGEISRLDVGIGCYKPKANEHIILRFSSWTQQSS
ncbi:hypothetical protein CgunFtcFv8_002682 [Champsocephalus gunnari]|uniref:DUF4430 domain-containing protein n=1 Tax=Champsocephalus gunnari TaxID=52237 RepID=A0AAN8HJC3_CHAGU|nr:hypothetical protein CgunFtcFv8_002682 [Champsocephalus gunnari]